MLEQFPQRRTPLSLGVTDFLTFSNSFGEVLKSKMVTDCIVSFYVDNDQLGVDWCHSSSWDEILSSYQEVQDAGKNFSIVAGLLMVPFRVEGGIVIAVISETDPIFLRKVSEDWLVEITRLAQREFLLLKQARVDSQTGLLNLSNLKSLLQNFQLSDAVHLIIVELVPKRFSYKQLFRHIHKCSSLLQAFVNDPSVLHYIGHCTFALVLKGDLGREKHVVESSLIAYLKRGGCPRVYVGSSVAGTNSETVEHKVGCNFLLDEAWSATQHAHKLGPYSFSTYQLLIHPENHPLCLPEKKLVRRLSRLWTSSERFCLVEFQIEDSERITIETFQQLIHRGKSTVHGTSVFVVLEQLAAEEAHAWATKIVNLGCQIKKGVSISAGISSYPFLGYRKTEMVLNCRKALLHASFYNDSSVALFDAVTLNISGDVYFGDGNLAKAVKEYRLGLKCDNRDINLHNSLGVTLALMDKLPAAVSSFKSGLSSEPDNFMALYNLGLLEQTRGQKSSALEYLRRAHGAYSHEDGQQELKEDLELQMGILSCEVAKFENSLELLKCWLASNLNQPRSGRVYYYLGKTYLGLEENRKAMEFLQKALVFDEFDDRAMSLLGQIYSKEKEGNDIALSLCRKSVELEPDNKGYILTMGDVYFSGGNLVEAKDCAYRCLRNKRTKTAAQFLLGKILQTEGQVTRARSWFLKVKKQKDVCQVMFGEATQRLSIINKQVTNG